MKVIKLNESELHRIVKRVINESGGDVSATVNHIKEYLNKLISIGKEKGINQTIGDKIMQLEHKMIVNILKIQSAIENYHPPHDDDDHDDDHHHYKTRNRIKRQRSSTVNEVKKMLKEGGEDIYDIITHIEDEMDKLNDAIDDAIEEPNLRNGFFFDNKLSVEMKKLYIDAWISFQKIVKHIEDYHPKSDKNHKEHNKDIKNTKHSAPIASNNKVNEGVKNKKNTKLIKTTPSHRIVKRVINEKWFNRKKKIKSFQDHNENKFRTEPEHFTHYDEDPDLKKGYELNKDYISELYKDYVDGKISKDGLKDIIPYLEKHERTQLMDMMKNN